MEKTTVICLYLGVFSVGLMSCKKRQTPCYVMGIKQMKNFRPKLVSIRDQQGIKNHSYRHA